MADGFKARPDKLWLIFAVPFLQSVFTTILKPYRNHCGSLEMLRLILERFAPEHYSPFALEMVLLIKQVIDSPAEKLIG